LLVYFFTSFYDIENSKSLSFINLIGIVAFLFTIVYMGTRPVSGDFFGDMGRYDRMFTSLKEGEKVGLNGDVVYYQFMKFCTYFMSNDYFFILSAFLYCYPMFVLSKKIFKEYWGYSFLLFISVFTFWSAGTNGMRNGLAASVFLLAISKDKKMILFGLMLLSTFIHKSLAVTSFAFLVAYFYTDSKKILYFWLLSIPLSFVFGGVLQSFFLNFGFGNEGRIDGYLTDLDDGIANSKSGFRLDFILYSATAVFTGWYFIFKRNFTDKKYILFFNTYLISNAFWILIIRANFSNRFAYLSWFFLPLIILYPILKIKFFHNQNKIFGLILLFFYVFSVFLIVLSN
jgi:hypothetical protein